MEPYEEAERREAEWDRKCEAAPHCDICGRIVYPGDWFLQLESGQCICEDCMSGADKVYTEDLDYE